MNRMFQSMIAMGEVAIVSLAVAAPAYAEVDSNHFDASLNYTLSCAGCHMEDGSGFPGRVPSFRGTLAKYLAVPEGRAYVVRVPGSANALLSSRNLAEVLNWAVRTYDPQDLPAHFVPYEEGEVASLRRDPDSAGTLARAQVLKLMDQASSAHAVQVSTSGGGSGRSDAPAAAAGSNTAAAAAVAPAQAKPLPAPAAFAICAACHPVSAGGEHSIGPNLRTVAGRPAGTAPNFAYSKAMRESGIQWTPAELDSYLTNVSAKVPGTLMAFPGLPDAADRQAVIEYLASLQAQ